MPRFLSEEWVDAFNAALAAVEVPSPAEDAGLAVRSGRFTVGQVVTGGPGGDVHTVLRVEDGAVSMERVDADQEADVATDVTVRLAWDDAVAMAQGRLEVVDALTGGRIRVRGDLSVLSEGGAILAALQPHLQELHAETTY